MCALNAQEQPRETNLILNREKEGDGIDAIERRARVRANIDVPTQGT